MISGAVSNKVAVERVTIPVDGLYGRDDSKYLLERALFQVEGVRRVYVNSATEMAYVEYVPEQCTPEQLSAAIEHEGFVAGVLVRR